MKGPCCCIQWQQHSYVFKLCVWLVQSAAGQRHAYGLCGHVVNVQDSCLKADKCDLLSHVSRMFDCAGVYQPIGCSPVGRGHTSGQEDFEWGGWMHRCCVVCEETIVLSSSHVKVVGNWRAVQPNLLFV